MAAAEARSRTLPLAQAEQLDTMHDQSSTSSESMSEPDDLLPTEEELLLPDSPAPSSPPSFPATHVEADSSMPALPLPLPSVGMSPNDSLPYTTRLVTSAPSSAVSSRRSSAATDASAAMRLETAPAPAAGAADAALQTLPANIELSTEQQQAVPVTEPSSEPTPAAPPARPDSSAAPARQRRIIHATVRGENAPTVTRAVEEKPHSAAASKDARVSANGAVRKPSAPAKQQKPAGKTSTPVKSKPAANGKNVTQGAAADKPRARPATTADEGVARTSSMSLSADVSTLVSTVEALRLQVAEQQASITDKDGKLAQLSQALILLQSQSAASTSAAHDSSVDVNKELSKRNRELSVQLAKERREYEQQLQQLRTAATVTPVGRRTTTGSRQKDDDGELNELAKQLAASKKAATELNTQLIDARRLHDVQKDLTRRWMKITHREVGDDQLTLEAAEASNSNGKAAGWKARAEQISLLQSKLAEARRQHQHQQQAVPTLFTSAAEDKYSTVLASKKLERHMDNAVLQSELQQSKAQLEEFRVRFESSKARVSVLEGDQRELRAKMATLLQKGDNDNKVIQSLREQINLQQLLSNSSTDASHSNTPASPTAKKILALKQRYESLLRQSELEVEDLRQANLRLQQANYQTVFESLSSHLAAAEASLRGAEQEQLAAVQRELTALQQQYDQAVQQINELSTAVIELDSKRVLQERTNTEKRKLTGAKPTATKAAASKADESAKALQLKLLTAETLLQQRDKESEQARIRETLSNQQRGVQVDRLQEAVAACRTDVLGHLQSALQQLQVEQTSNAMHLT